MQPYPQYGATPPAMGPAYGMPNPAYGPPPGYYPPPMPAFNTREGVKYFSQVLMLQIIIGLLGFVLAIAAIGLILSLGTGSWAGALGGIIAIASAAVILVILAIITLILYIAGWVKFYQGKEEFGPVHSKNFMMAVVFFILGFVLPYAGNAFSPSYEFGDTVTSIYDSIRASLIISGITGIIGPLFSALMYTTMVKAFTAEEAGKFKTGTILIILGPVIGLVAMLVMLPGKPGTGVSAADLISFSAVASMGLSLGGILSLIGYYFFYQGYKSIHAKMQQGVIRPGAMQAPMAPQGNVPPPVPPQPYPPQPMAPAPYQPPPPMAAPTPSCLTCGNPLPPGALVCPRYGGRV